MQGRIISSMIALFLTLSIAPAQVHVDQPAEARPRIKAQEINSDKVAYPANHRIKVAEGEYAIARIGDLGIQPPGTEEFEFGETWTLWLAMANSSYKESGVLIRQKHCLTESRSCSDSVATSIHYL
jgi:hypothetical protein